MIRKLFIIFISLFCHTSIEAQYSIHYTVDNGLPTNHIYQIEQDANGFMWFATNMGIVKFDGNHFKVFTTQNGLRNNDVWRLEATEDGKIWYFSKTNRLGYISDDKVYSFPIDGNKLPHISSYIIGEGVKFSFYNNKMSGIYELQDGKWSITTQRIKNSLFAGKCFIANEAIVDIVNLKLVDKEFNVIFNFNLKTPLIPYDYGKNINKNFFFEKEGIYFAANHQDIYTLNLKDSTAYIQHLFDTLIAVQNDIYIPEIQQYKGQFQISQLNEWIHLGHNNKIVEKRYFDTPGLPVHIFKDNTGNFWTAGHDYGITIFPSYSLENKYYFKEKKVQSVDFFNNQLFINIYDDGWYVFDRVQNQFRLVISNKGKVYGMGYHPKFKIYYFYSNQSIWYGKNLDNITHISTYLIYSKIYGSKYERAGAKCIIENEDGFSAIRSAYYYDFDSSFNLIRDENKFNDEWTIPISKTFINFRNRRFVGGEGLFEVYDYNKTKQGKHPLLQSPVNVIIPYNDTLMLVGTDGFGAYFYDGNNTVVPLIGSEGFSINRIILHGEDIWLSTGKGVHQFVKRGAMYALNESIYDEDGLLSNNANSICIVDNQLYVAHDNGLTQMNIETGKYKKNIYVSLSTNQYSDTGNVNSLITQYGDNLSLQFVIQAYPSQKYIKYFYKTNTDDKWIATEVSTLVMGKQAPGDYKIYFKAVDQHGNVGQLELKLKVLPLWYQTKWAQIVLITIIMVIVIFITILFRKRIDNKKKAELKLNKDMAELELKALRSQMNPHFVFNSLNAIQYFIVKNKMDQSEEYLAKFSRLIRLFFEYSNYESLKISQEIDLLNRYLEIEKLRFEDKLVYAFHVDTEINEDELEVPSMILQPIVENSVNHGIFHKKSTGTVIISFKKINDSSILISVDDDGIGILAMKEIQKDSYGNYKSKSSEVIKERLKILSANKLSKWHVEYTIQDKSLVHESQTGTLVEILIKYK